MLFSMNCSMSSRINKGNAVLSMLCNALYSIYYEGFHIITRRSLKRVKIIFIEILTGL